MKNEQVLLKVSHDTKSKREATLMDNLAMINSKSAELRRGFCLKIIRFLIHKLAEREEVVTIKQRENLITKLFFEGSRRKRMKALIDGKPVC